MEVLEHQLGQRFVKERHGLRQEVILEEVRRDKVKIREIDHADPFTLPIAKFQKFYHPTKETV